MPAKASTVSATDDAKSESKTDSSMADESVLHRKRFELKLLRQQLVDHEKAEKAKSIDARYKQLKFIEKQKLQRRRKQLLTQLRTLTTDSNESNTQEGLTERELAIRTELQHTENDLDYIEFFPSGVKYVALFPSEKEESADLKQSIDDRRNELRILAQQAKALHQKRQGSIASSLKVDEVQTTEQHANKAANGIPNKVKLHDDMFVMADDDLQTQSPTKTQSVEPSADPQLTREQKRLARAQQHKLKAQGGDVQAIAEKTVKTAVKQANASVSHTKAQSNQAKQSAHKPSKEVKTQPSPAPPAAPVADEAKPTVSRAERRRLRALQHAAQADTSKSVAVAPAAALAVTDAQSAEPKRSGARTHAIKRPRPEAETESAAHATAQPSSDSAETKPMPEPVVDPKVQAERKALLSSALNLEPEQDSD